MEKVLRKVSVKDRNPINKGVYIGGSCSYQNEKIYWHGYWDEHWQEDHGDVEYWYEEVDLMDLLKEKYPEIPPYIGGIQWLNNNNLANLKIIEDANKVVNFAKERYEKALKSIQQVNYTRCSQKDLDKALKIAAGIEEDKV